MDHPLDSLLLHLAKAWRTEGTSAALATADLFEEAVSGQHRKHAAHAKDQEIRESLAYLATPEAELALSAHSFIPWSYSAVLDPAYDPLGSLFAAASLIGPAVQIKSDHYRAGLFLQFPNRDYPLHSHAADESYIILAGSGTWVAGDTKTTQPPGTLIHHPSDLPHALLTTTEPVLAAWRWSGNIDPATYRLNNQPRTSGVKYIGN